MEFLIDKNMASQRFDRFCRKYFKPYQEIGLSEIYRWIRKGEIRVNGKKTPEQYQLQEGDKILIKDFVCRQLPPLTKKEKIERLSYTTIRKQLLHEDEHWLVFDKPAGIPMHGGTKNTETLCMNNYLEKYVESIGSSPRLCRGAPVSHPATERGKGESSRFGPPCEGGIQGGYCQQNHPTFKPSFCYRLDKDTS